MQYQVITSYSVSFLLNTALYLSCLFMCYCGFVIYIPLLKTSCGIVLLFIYVTTASLIIKKFDLEMSLGAKFCTSLNILQHCPA